MYLWFHKLGSPPHFYRIAGKWMPWLASIFLVLLLTGLYGGLVLAPPDYQQGESYRIIFVHVPRPASYAKPRLPRHKRP